MSIPTQSTEMQHTRVRTEGITVVGEAVRRVAPEQAEFLMEITATASTAAQALRDNQAKTTQITQALETLGVQQPDVQTISMNVYNVYSPLTQALPAYGAMPQLNPGFGSGGFGPGGFTSGMNGGMMPFAAGMQTEVQFGSCQARCTLRINVRDAARVGEVLDAVARAGASVSPFCFKTPDEAGVRRSALEAAGKDARVKAEVLAGAAGRKLGEAIAIAEDIVASNGTYAALRSAFPFSFGAGAPQVAGELEYYARVSASFRFQ